MSFNQVIKTHFQPTIKLIELGDFDNSADAKGPVISRKERSMPDFSQIAGKLTPFVKIEGLIVNNIEKLVIDESGFVPTLDLIFSDGSGEFSGSYFPKRNLMVSLFINSDNPKFKPIRSDYLITSIKSIPHQNRGNRTMLASGITYIIKAELFVPRLYNNISKGYSNMTSIDVLKTICKELGLGFAQNEFTSDDSMTWINPNTSPYNFIRDILNHSYIRDKEFVTGFISKELILNMINVNEQLKNGETSLTFPTSATPLIKSLSQDQKNELITEALDEVAIDNLLTNKKSNSGKSNYIYEANLISEHGSILKKEGYLKKIYYYDHFDASENDKDKIKKFYISPTNTDGLSEASMLIPSDEGLDEIGNKKWMDINYGNTHEHWNAARVFNSHNLKELEKVKLKVLLKGINFQVIRGMTIPLLMTQSIAEKADKESTPDNLDEINPNSESPDTEVLDSQLTGWYYVKEAKYIFDPQDPHQFLTELILARREWSPNKIIFTANA